MSRYAQELDLFCLPWAGASANMYLRWRRRLPEWIRVIPVELPGRGARLGEPHEKIFHVLSDQLCKEMVAQIQRPWALFGHSMGALLAIDLSRRLQFLEVPEQLGLLVSGSPAPSRRDPDRFPAAGDEIELIADLRHQGGTPPEIFDNPELLHMTLHTLDADYRVCESFCYHPSHPLNVPIHAFAGRGDEIESDRVAAWQTETQSEFTLHWFDGGHFFIHQYEADVLRVLESALRRVRDHRFDSVIT